LADSKNRVAVLGGGVAALSAAFALTELDPGGQIYDITVYQLGWRLGGKIANGRNAALGQRIEEHGLHIWAGFYENAFTIMRCVFRGLGRAAGTPMAGIADAFIRQNIATFAESYGGQTTPWPFWFEPDPDPSVFPGRDDLMSPPQGMLTLAAVIRRIVGFLQFNHDFYGSFWTGDVESQAAGVVAAITTVPHTMLRAMQGATVPGSGHPLLDLAGTLGEQLENGIDTLRDPAGSALMTIIGAYRTLAEQSFLASPQSTELRRAFTLIDVYSRVGVGIISNGCLRDGLVVLDKYDLREFLAANGPPSPTLENAVVEAGYDYAFAYEAGSRTQPRLSACTAVQGFFRLITYKGAFFFKATAGMGDTVAAPLYQILKQRGVTFKFFHQVSKIEPNADGTKIGTIEMVQQAALKPGLSEYAPLVVVNGIDCWPSAPLWEQINDGEKLEAAGVAFEDFYQPQPSSAVALSLQVDRDFDTVILGISVGALGEICRPLCEETTQPARAQAWSDLCTKVLTVRTQALQLWTVPAVPALGGAFMTLPASHPREGAAPIVTAGLPPLDTYADMSHVLPAEAWPAGAGPGAVGYFCAVLDDAAAPNDLALATDAVKSGAVTWMESWLGNLWTVIGGGASFNWNILYSPGNLQGAARMDEQYVRANISPSDRYVLSVPGSLQYRLDPGGSFYRNLYLAGDWTRVAEINAGCVEVAAMSGLAAAAALSGVAIPIASFDTLYRQSGWG
jgi:uncharacterized protein with NAD-binding domain and iron-sulfur cluster